MHAHAHTQTPHKRSYAYTLNIQLNFQIPVYKDLTVNAFYSVQRVKYIHKTIF